MPGWRSNAESGRLAQCVGCSGSRMAAFTNGRVEYHASIRPFQRDGLTTRFDYDSARALTIYLVRSEQAIRRSRDLITGSSRNKKGTFLSKPFSDVRFGGAAEFLDYLGASPCIRTKTASGQSNST